MEQRKWVVAVWAPFWCSYLYGLYWDIAVSFEIDRWFLTAVDFKSDTIICIRKEWNVQI